jgi:SAM-dependent methyltransferase
VTTATRPARARGAVLLSSGRAETTSLAPASGGPFPDYRFAPNIGGHPESYELENVAVDRAGHVLPAMRALAPWAGKTIVDLGCGTGFWLRRYADAARVIGVEPNPSLRTAAAAGAGAAGVGAATGLRAEVRAGSAEHIPLPDGSADVVHARFAYFFPPGADAGLTEVLRVLRPGGCLVVVDNDYRWGEFADLLAASAARSPRQTAAAVDAWWQDRGAGRQAVQSELRFASRAELAAVLRIEVPGPVADAWLRRNPTALSLTYGFVLFAVRAGT